MNVLLWLFFGLYDFHLDLVAVAFDELEDSVTVLESHILARCQTPEGLIFFILKVFFLDKYCISQSDTSISFLLLFGEKCNFLSCGFSEVCYCNFVGISYNHDSRGGFVKFSCKMHF